MLLKMLEMEESIRMSPAYIKECTKVENEVNGWLRISGEIQEKIVSLYGYNNPIMNILAVNHLRRAQYLYPGDSRFKTTQVYVRNNLAEVGNLSLGDIAPNVKLFDLD